MTNAGAYTMSVQVRSRSEKTVLKEALKTEGWLDYAKQDAHILAEAIRQYKMVELF